jgi:TRAP-type mannitol/chloroaromatic compound transport system permease small subunit
MTVADVPEARPGPLMRAALAFQHAVDRLNEVAGGLSRWFVLATIVVGLANTVLRYIGRLTGRQLTSNTWVEMQWNLYSMIFILGFGYILKHGVNVRVDFWFTNQPRRRKLRIDLVGHIISLVPFTVMGIWISQSAVRTSWTLRERSPNAGGLPLYPIKTMILVALVLLFLQSLAEIVKVVAELRGIAAEHEEPEAPIRIE